MSKSMYDLLAPKAEAARIYNEANPEVVALRAEVHHLRNMAKPYPEGQSWFKTIMNIIILCALVRAVTGKADESWLCTEESSQRSGNLFKVCGIGQGPNEGVARAQALTTARQEFQALCESSSDCTGHLVNIRPMRTTCHASGATHQCHRLVEFTIGESVAQAQQAQEDAHPHDIMWVISQLNEQTAKQVEEMSR